MLICTSTFLQAGKNFILWKYLKTTCAKLYMRYKTFFLLFSDFLKFIQMQMYEIQKMYVLGLLSLTYFYILAITHCEKFKTIKKEF